MEFHFTAPRTQGDRPDTRVRTMVVLLSCTFYVLSVANLIANSINYFHVQMSYARGIPFVESLRAVRWVFIVSGIAIILGDLYLVAVDA